MHMKTSAADRDIRHNEMTRRIAGYAATLLLIAGATVAGLLIASRWGNEPVALLYIPPVLVAALICGLWPALVAAAISTLTYNFYFTVPYRTFFINNPADVVTVTALFLVAVVTSRLAASLREQSRRADAHAARNATIAGLARRLLSRSGEAAVAEIAVRELARLFRSQAALVIGHGEPQIIASVPTSVALPPSDLAAAALTLETGAPSGRGVRRVDLADWQFHPINSERAVLAAVGLAREDGLPPVAGNQRQLLGNLLDQIALALERARLEGEAREVAALRERDRLRSALLTSIGEDVKPRLNAIAAAARTLRRSEGGDKSLATTVAAETAQLGRYIDALVDLSPGDDQEPLNIGPLAIDLHRRIVRRDGKDVHLTPKEYAVLAELAKHSGRVLTHAHLLRSVWGPAQQDNIDYLRVAVRNLRQKLEQDPARPALIINEPAVGYRLALQ
ncbi:Osmosensitive K+ channel signal transduction histidine kinase [Sphingobium herbicidovorans NBRC 16415]|uniref:Osmosensitive K+ channel signal transduction histidine kinase n=2 Tax=Sphingobium herbicidovorans TaxID=76947 RepID=A0A086P8Q6_SPHHM|nr:Osmosensitive K+ channel signal transduction histidine kinase [Sphingobium herbicidovorans NBRC 16415]